MRVIVILSMCFFSFQSSAQSFLEGKPNWEYDFYWICAEIVTGNTKILYEKDSIIDAIEYVVFEEHWSRTDFYGFTTSGEGLIMLREEGDFVYWRHFDGSEELIYDFTYSQGDTMFIAVENLADECDSIIPAVCDSISTVEVNAHALDIQYWKLLDSSEVFSDFQIMDKIGVLGNFYLNMRFNWVCAIDHCNPHSFMCYHNDELDLSFPNEDCEDIISTSTASLGFDESLRIFPNPASTKLSVRSEKRIASIQIIDSDGKAILHSFQTELDVSDMVSGLYLLLVVYEDGNRQVEKISLY